MRRRHGWMIALLVALPLATGCDFFEPDEPPLPPSGAVPIVPDFTDPDRTLETVRLAVEAKALRGGPTAYALAFAESTITTTPEFHQFFSLTDANQWVLEGRSVPSDWQASDERDFFANGARSLISLRPENYVMTWTPEDGNPREEGNGFFVYHQRYRIVAVDQAGNVAYLVAKGFADLTITQLANSDWKITRWSDRVDPEPELDPTLTPVTLGRRRLEF
ncbi:MAG: hypothetical protein HOP12_00080 [Candidatus Eisenbacteria bacterium]|uniref:Lipoprotein n=1 Tax=Eiseniibacteriota bacterium TaxID=2212470 RepID=A0A849SM82_UNCEI|nr:hypothetical protein [Candidatus Eisenbacteria bacterium]